MRHDPAGASIVIMLRSLKLHGMAQAVDDLIAQGAPAFEAATPILSQLLKAEMAEREVRSIAYLRVFAIVLVLRKGVSIPLCPQEAKGSLRLRRRRVESTPLA
jgi:hypothetical protein